MEELTLPLSIGFNALDIINFVDAHASYLFVFLLMAVESSFIPFPSEAVVPPAVYFMLGAIGTFNFGVVLVIVIAATAGALVGALVNYYLSLWLGRPIVYRFANSRVGHFFLVTEEKVKKSEEYFDKHGPVATFIGRLIPAVRQLISIPAGLSRMNIVKFCTFTSLGAFVWNCILAGLGVWLFTAVKKDDLYATVEKYNGYLTIGGLCLLGICMLYMIYKAMTAKKSQAKA
ncbi:MAG: DedA family protein [Muribaculaceae bacterium]|nr:DedA family protein [Muribaculaceae bacterium]MDE6345435.1 DedA family protein [Muribaculaceae bacterium]